MAHLRDLQLRGAAQGYYLEPIKSILVPRAKEYFQGMGIQIVTGIRYLGGFVEEREAEESWIQEKIDGWAESDHKHPQSAYAGMQKSLQ